MTRRQNTKPQRFAVTWCNRKMVLFKIIPQHSKIKDSKLHLLSPVCPVVTITFSETILSHLNGPATFIKIKVFIMSFLSLAEISDHANLFFRYLLNCQRIKFFKMECLFSVVKQTRWEEINVRKKRNQNVNFVITCQVFRSLPWHFKRDQWFSSLYQANWSASRYSEATTPLLIDVI